MSDNFEDEGWIGSCDNVAYILIEVDFGLKIALDLLIDISKHNF